MRTLATAALALFLCLPATQVRAAPWEGYRATMWVDNLPTTPEGQKLYFQRLAEMGCNAGMVYPGDEATPYVRNGFPFYVENLTRGLYLRGDAARDKAFEGYKTTKDPKYLIRTPSLSDPVWQEEQRKRIEELVTRYRGDRPFLYDIRDESSITLSADPFDFDFSPVALTAFRKWLQGQYGTLEALNGEWDTTYASWDEVKPLTTDEMKALDRQGSENYAQWCDFRSFMDTSFAQAADAFRGYIHKYDPAGLAGLEGLQMPSAFGGFDLWKLSQVMDWLEPYDIANSRAIFGAFCPEKPIFSTIFDTNPNRMERQLWRLALEGDAGVIIWHGKDTVDTSKPDLPLTPYAKALSKPLKELTGEVGTILRGAKRLHDPIAIHYSQPSLQVDWLLETRVDGDSWLNRFSSWESIVNELAAARGATVKLLQDLGYQPTFISSEQIEQDQLKRQGIKVLILIRSLALSEREAEQIEQFAKAGGVVIADGACGLFDEHGKQLPTARLVRLFGKQQREAMWGGEGLRVRNGVPELSADLTGVTSSESPVSAAPSTPGEVTGTYLNLDLRPYEKQRLTGGGQELRDLFSGLLAKAGLRRAGLTDAATGKAPSCVEVQRYQAGDTYYIALQRNPQTEERPDLKPDTANAEVEKPVRMSVDLLRVVPGALISSQSPAASLLRAPSDAVIRGATVTATLDPWSPLIIRVNMAGVR
jgi:hypothetical protein